MTKTLARIALWVIYIGAALALAVPLFVDNQFFFPFITTKIMMFRTIVEVMALAYLLLNLVSSSFRPRWNMLSVSLILFTVWATLSSLLGGKIGASFWGDVERGEGIIIWLYILAFFFITFSAIREQRSWRVFLDISLLINWVMMLLAFGQFFHYSRVLASSGGRVDATLGNAAFYAAYLLFHVAFAAYLFLESRKPAAKIYYAATGLCAIFLIFATQTRGTVIGLVAGLLFAGLILLWKYRGQSAIKGFSVALFAAVVLGIGLLFVFRHTTFVNNNTVLHRLVSISTRERTAQTRFITWRAAWHGWKEKFVFGWGYENFDRVFNKYFPPKIYEDAGSQVWFDRAHNLIFDRGLTTGAVGLLIFLSLFIYPFFRFVRQIRNGENVIPATIFAGFLIAYLIQDLFVFESVTAYILLAFIWAFWSANFLPVRGELNLSGSGKVIWGTALAIYLAATPTVFYKTVWQPGKINIAMAAVGHMNLENDSFFAIVDDYKKILKQPTYGRREYRLQFIEFVDQSLANVGEVMPEVKPVLSYTDDQVAAHIAEDPEDAKGYLLAMRHYNYTHGSLPDERVERTGKALSFYPKLAALSPSRPQVHQEAGYSHLYLYRFYLQKNDKDKAAAEAVAARELFRKTVELNPQVVESYINLAMLYLNTGDDAKMKDLISEMDRRSVNFRKHAFLSQLDNLAKSNQRVNWVGYFSEELVKLNPEDVTGWIDLALFYASGGNRSKAIEIAQHIKEFGGQYVDEANKFIENVNKGLYEKKGQ